MATSSALTAATRILVLRSRIALSMSCGMGLYRPAKRVANMTEVLTPTAKLISETCRAVSHTVFFMDRSVNRDVMHDNLDTLSADGHCHMEHARQYAGQAAAANVAEM